MISAMSFTELVLYTMATFTSPRINDILRSSYELAFIVYVKVSILFTDLKHKQEIIISHRSEVHVHKINLIPQRFIKVPIYTKQDIKRLCLYKAPIYFACFYDFSIGSTVLRGVVFLF